MESTESSSGTSGSRAPRPIFRKTALEGISSPDQLDQLMHVTDTKGWLALVALFGLIAALLAWGLFGSLEVEIRGRGILLRSDAIREVVTVKTGLVSSVEAKAGDMIQAGQVIVWIWDEQGTKTEVMSYFDGMLLEVLVQSGMVVIAGMRVATLELPDKQLQVVAFVPVAEGKRVQRGQQVRISPSTVDPGEYGYMLGEVDSVSAFPASQERMKLVLQNERLVQSLSAGGPVVEIVVNLMTTDSRAGTGFRWSSNREPPTVLTSGTLCDLAFILGRQRPTNLFLSSE